MHPPHRGLLVDAELPARPTVPVWTCLRREEPAVSLPMRCEVRAHLPLQPSLHSQLPALGGAAPTFAVRDVGRAVKVSAGVARAADAVVLAKLGLVGAHRAADAPVGGRVIVVAGGAVHCGGGAGAGGKGRPFPQVSLPSSLSALSSGPFPGALCPHSVPWPCPRLCRQCLAAHPECPPSG